MIDKFTSKDIVNIISACHKNNVKHIKLDVMEIRFSGNDFSEPDLTVAPEAIDLRSHVESESDDFDIATDIHKMTLLAEDPLLYEKMMEEEVNEIRYRETEPSLSRS